MEILTLIQGSPEWHEFRLSHFGASEAAAMLGLSKNMKRTELLHMKSTGIAKEFSDWLQKNVLDKGHEVEALARPIIEKMIGADLYPVTCKVGRLSASCDGLTMIGDTALEHKQWNAEYAEMVRNGIVPEEHEPQCYQILLVTGADKVIFTISDGTEERMEKTYVYPDEKWFDRIRAGWAQFEKDLADYQHRKIAEKPVADAIMDLPALSVQATGMVTYSNMPEFKAAAQAYIANINTELATDEDFSNAEATVKFCKSTEDKLDLTKNAILAQTATIDEVIRTVDHIQAQLRDKRLQLDKLVKSEKERRKLEMVAAIRVKYADHVSKLQDEISGIILLSHLIVTPDFGGALRGLKSLASMHDALDTLLANSKIEADAMAIDVRRKLDWFNTMDQSYKLLFSDLQMIIGMDANAFRAIVTNRITEYKAAEAARIEANVKAEAEAKARIQAEEQASKALNDADDTKTSPEQKQSPVDPVQVVIAHQDEIAAFMKLHDFGKSANKIRAVLVEFVKFMATQNCNQLISNVNSPTT